MKTVVLVPFRPDGGHRDRLWRHLQDTFWSGFRYRLHVGGHDGGRFNRSAAINAAAGMSDWDVAVIADSDTWVPAHQLDEAVRAAHDCGRLVSALSGVVELDRRCTESVLSGRFSPGCLSVDRVRTSDLDTQSSMLVVSRRLWDDIGGFDERFVGWGGEDNAFWRAASIIAGPPRRVQGFAFHLWHVPAVDARRSDPGYQANLRRWNRYRAARTVHQLRAAQNAA